MLDPAVAEALKSVGVTDSAVRKFLDANQPATVAAAIEALGAGAAELAAQRRQAEARVAQRPTVEAGLRRAELAVTLRTSGELERARESTEQLRRRRDEARLDADEVVTRLARFTAYAERNASKGADPDRASDDHIDVATWPGVRAIQEATAAYAEARRRTDRIGHD
ncbi:MAG: hypothetical protein QOK28_3392 [Actinomycetota bacterium]|jgi:hypothetical protein